MVRKAVFPVAGLGTRFLPATKAIPKEMLPVVDKPLIQYAVEEAVAAGITDLIFVTSGPKRSIEDHFDVNLELEHTLDRTGKDELAKVVRGILPHNVNCYYVRQHEALGLGHAVLCAKNLVGNEPFAVILPDDMIYSYGDLCLKTMIDHAEHHQASVVAVEEVPWADVSKYGVIAPSSVTGRVHTVSGVVEKPPVDEAPSNLTIVGRYILQPEIFGLLEHTGTGAGGEVQLTDAIGMLLQESPVFGYQFSGKRYDCGSKLGYLKANVDYGLRHEGLCTEFLAYLREVIIPSEGEGIQILNVG